MISQNFIESNLPKGKLTLVGGRPNIGKTSFAISLAIVWLSKIKELFISPLK